MVLFEEIDDPQLKSDACEKVLMDLPEWFGIEESTNAYIQSVATNIFIVAKLKNEVVGFVAFKKHFKECYEINVMGVLKSHHHQGIGSELLKQGEILLKKKGIKFLQVKTLSESKPDKNYDKTRGFYFRKGFYPVEEFKNLWDEFNPCLLLIKAL